MKQVPGFDGLPFDPFSLRQDSLAAPKVDIGRDKVLQALVVVVVIVVIDEGINLLHKLAEQAVVFQPDAFLEDCCQRSIFPWV